MTYSGRAVAMQVIREALLNNSYRCESSTLGTLGRADNYSETWVKAHTLPVIVAWQTTRARIALPIITHPGDATRLLVERTCGALAFDFLGQLSRAGSWTFQYPALPTEEVLHVQFTETQIIFSCPLPTLE